MNSVKVFGMSAKNWKMVISAFSCGKSTNVSIGTEHENSSSFEVWLDMQDVPKLIACLEDILTTFIEESR